MNFDQVFATIASIDGGYSDRDKQADPGGATRWGITEEVARAWGFKGDMRDLPFDTPSPSRKRGIGTNTSATSSTRASRIRSSTPRTVQAIWPFPPTRVFAMCGLQPMAAWGAPSTAGLGMRARLREQVWAQRMQFCFDTHVPALVDFFRTVIDGASKGPRAAA